MNAPDDDSGSTLYPMRVVTRRTGLTPDVLRVWERRYGIVNPTRSEGGHRLYSAHDLEKLTTLSRLVRAGHRIAMLARKGDAELAALNDQPAPTPGDRSAEIIATALEAVERYDSDAIERALRGSAMSFPAVEWLERVLHPFLVEVGERWHRGEISPANEHLASAVVRDTLGWMLGTLAPASDAPVVIIGTPGGELHEFGAMMAAVVAAQSGWRVRYLGPNLPAEVLADSAHTLEARAVALSAVLAIGEPMVQIEKLRGLLGATPLIVGGRGAETRRNTLAAIGVLVAEDVSELREHLDAAG